MNEFEPPPRRLSRAEATERTRRRLLAAAATVVARRGIAGASVDEIAETAGYTVGALYSRFGSKDALVAAAMQAHVGEQVAEARWIMEAGSVDDEGSRSALGALLARMTDTADAAAGSTAPLFWAEMWLHAARNPELAEPLVAHARAVDEVITESIRSRRTAAGAPSGALSGGADPVSDEALATIVSSLFRGLAQRRRVDPDAVPDHLLGQALRLLVAGRRALRTDRTEGERP